MKEFARTRNIDLKYFVDGANFVISKMHFNPENNFYTTLGVSHTAADEEIRERWKKLMLLYHPDRQAGEWVSERAKKVNEAYSELKDAQRRAEYDRTIRVIRQDHGNEGTATPRPPAARTGFSKRQSSFVAKSPLLRYMPRILIGLYIVFALGVIAFLYIRDRSPMLEEELTPRAESGRGLRSDGAEVKRTETEGQTTNRQVLLGEMKPPQGPHSGEVKPSSHLSPDRPRDNYARAKAAGSVPGDTEAAARRGVRPVSLVNAERQADEPSRRDQQRPVRQPAQGPNSAEPGTPVSYEKKTPEPVQQRQGLTAEDIVVFMKSYSEAYEKGDLERFMSHFSLSLRENNANYAAVRNLYKKTFQEKIEHYRLMDLKIKINDNHALVSATYNLNRYSSPKGEWLNYTGRVKWKIVKEGEALKITSAEYDY